MQLSEEEAIHNKALFYKSIIMIVLVAIAFIVHGFFHIEPSVIALAAAGIMLVISGADIEKVVHDVEWTTIRFVHSCRRHGGNRRDTDDGTMAYRSYEWRPDALFDNPRLGKRYHLFDPR